MNHPEIDQDLIYAGSGQSPSHVPVRDCGYTTGWLFDRKEIVFWEKYSYQGRLVKDCYHVYHLPKETTLRISAGDLDVG
jgi:hypothetical protein